MSGRFTRRVTPSGSTDATRWWEAIWEDPDGIVHVSCAQVSVFRLEPEHIRYKLGVPSDAVESWIGLLRHPQDAG